MKGCGHVRSPFAWVEIAAATRGKANDFAIEPKGRHR